MIEEEMTLIELAVLTQRMIASGYDFEVNSNYAGYKTFVFYVKRDEGTKEIHEEHKYPEKIFPVVGELLSIDNKKIKKYLAVRSISPDYIKENISELKVMDNAAD